MASVYERQIASPDHCYIKIGEGLFLRHGDRDLSPDSKYKRGELIRFTRLAAERIIKADESLRRCAKMIPCK